MILFQGQMATEPGSYAQPRVKMTQTVDLGQPITQYCKVLLRGFKLSYFATDRNVQDMHVQLQCAFGDDLQHADLTAEIMLADEDGQSGVSDTSIFPWGEHSERIMFSLYYTIVGE